MSWTTPVTNWTADRKFNLEDYNRIKNNLKYLKTLADSIYRSFDITELGEDLSDEEHWWSPIEINALEDALDEIFRASALPINIGEKKSFQYNGLFIQYSELNRIESACLNIYTLAQSQARTRKHLKLVLGGVQF
jgi:hypothetical protein